MTDWKDDERALGAWAGGKRLPSNGKVQADVVSPDEANVEFAFEVKARKAANFPQWLTHAFDQADLHRRLYRVDNGYVALFLHQGRGTQTRVFLCREIKLSDDGFRATIDDLEKHAALVAGLIRALKNEEVE